MKTTKTFALLSILAVTAFIFSCKKDSGTGSSITLNRPAYQKRWNISSVINRPATGSANYENLSLFRYPVLAHRPASPANYSAIEFLLNSYVVFFSDGTVTVGQYTATNDTTLVLDSLGTIHILSLNSNTFNFTITPIGNSGSVTIKATPAPLTIPVTNTADSVFFTSTWILDSTVSDGFSSTSPDMYAIFSQYGTYLTHDTENGADDYGTNTWLWSNNAHTSFCYGAWDGSNLVNCNGAGSVTITSYQPPYAKLVLQENYKDSGFSYNATYYLHH